MVANLRDARTQSDASVVTGAQLRGARGLLNLSVTELAEMSGLGLNTIRRAEATNGVSALTTANMKTLMTVLEGAGIVFIPGDHLGPGVRLRDLEPLPMRPRRRNGDGS